MYRLTRRALIGSLPLSIASAGAAKPKTRVIIQPLGPSASLVAPVERALAAFYAIELGVAALRPLPKRAYYRPRARYRAEILLEDLAESAPAGIERVLGLTSVDISTTKPPHADWGVLGLASLGGRACVLSAFRCRRGAKNEAHALARLAKTAVHELGHTFGLEHCANRGCLMEDGAGSVLTTDREYDLCAACRRELERAGYLRADATSPWKEPPQ